MAELRRSAGARSSCARAHRAATRAAGGARGARGAECLAPASECRLESRPAHQLFAARAVELLDVGFGTVRIVQLQKAFHAAGFDQVLREPVTREIVAPAIAR